MTSRLRSLVMIGAPLGALAGVLIFVGSVAVDLAIRNLAWEGLLRPPIGWALFGLILATAMFALWFGLVAILLTRQSRELGSGYGDAYRLIERFRFDEAIPLLERSIQEGKETAEVLMLLTSAYAYTGQLGKAQLAADRAVQRFPNHPGSYVTLANGYRLQGAYDEAAEALGKAVQLAPNQAVLWAELGFAQHLAGERDRAFQSFERAARARLPAMYAIRVYHHLTKAYNAIGEFRKAKQAHSRMRHARGGLPIWQSGQEALDGTGYGQALGQEIDEIRTNLLNVGSGQQV